MHASPLVVFLAIAPIAAQTVSVSATAVTPLTVSATLGAQAQTASVPAGVLPPFGFVQAFLVGQGNGHVSSRHGWQSITGPYAASYIWQLDGSLVGSVPGSADTAVCDVLVQVQASAPVTVRFEVVRTISATAGVSVPLERIDIGNDGVFEVTEASPLTTTLPAVQLGTQPLSILVRTSMSLAVAGSIATQGQLLVKPANDLQIQNVMSGCYTNPLNVLPTFADRGISTFLTALSVNPVVGVFGLGVQPQILPSPIPYCVLLPEPDLLVLFQPNASFDIALPAAVRPASLWIQGVAVLNGLATTDAYRVQAW